MTNKRRLNTGLWAAQGLVGVTLIGGGIWKLATPVDDLAEIFPWAGEVSPILLHATSAIDVVGGIGVLLPAITGIKPQLTVAAAVGCAALQASAIVFHLSRGESDVLVNVALGMVSLFIGWGRAVKVPLAPRLTSSGRV
jgi:hypothetical protein